MKKNKNTLMFGYVYCFNDYIKYIKPKKTIFTHMTALLDEEKLISKCPKNVLPAFDGMEIEI